MELGPGHRLWYLIPIGTGILAIAAVIELGRWVSERSSTHQRWALSAWVAGFSTVVFLFSLDRTIGALDIVVGALIAGWGVVLLTRTMATSTKTLSVLARRLIAVGLAGIGVCSLYMSLLLMEFL